MKYISILFIFLGSICFGETPQIDHIFVKSKVMEIDHFDGVLAKVLEEANGETLVLFDVDDVLLRPTDEYCFREEIRLGLMKEMSAKYSIQELNEIYAEFFLKREVIPVNEGMKGLLEELSKRKIDYTGLTAWWTGKFGVVGKMEEVRFKDLNDVGISFIDSSPFKKEISFPSHKTEKGGTPMITRGLILVAFGSKGEILGLSLDHLDKEYKKIIFVDDHKKYIDQVQKLCAQRGMEYVGIHYTEASKMAFPELDIEKEKLRFEILEKEHVWLTDSELLKRS